MINRLNIRKIIYLIFKRRRLMLKINQAGGHSDIISFDGGQTICKKLDEVELAFYQNIEKDQDSKWLDFIPKFIGVKDDYLILENLLLNFQYPSILDIKLGTRLYDNFASSLKKSKTIEMSKNTTSGSFGLRISGMRKDNLNIKDKDGRKYSKKEFLNKMNLFFDKKNVVNKSIKKVNELIKLLRVDPKYRLYSSSLLVIYDDTNITIKLIDFAHARLGSSEENIKDLIFSLNNLRNILKAQYAVLIKKKDKEKSKEIWYAKQREINGGTVAVIDEILVSDLMRVHIQNNRFIKYDVIINLLAIENICGKNDYGLDIYKRVKKYRNGGMSDEEIEKDIEKFKILINNIEKNSYDRNCAIKLTRNYFISNGSHRVACCLYFGINKISYRFIKKRPLEFHLDWLKENGFSGEEIDRLHKKLLNVMSGFGGFKSISKDHICKNIFFNDKKDVRLGYNSVKKGSRRSKSKKKRNI